MEPITIITMDDTITVIIIITRITVTREAKAIILVVQAAFIS